MSSSLLSFFRYIFLAVLYLFFIRVLRAVWIELREPKTVEVPAGPAPAPRSPPTPAAPAAPSSATEATAFTPAAQLRESVVVVAPEELAGLRFELADEMTIGRAPGCGISLPADSFVSSVHARVFRHGGEVLVEDLGSTNGTFLDGVKVDGPAVLRPGARLQVGQTTLERSG